MGRLWRFAASATGAAALILPAAVLAPTSAGAAGDSSWASARLSFLPLAGTTLSADGIGSYRGSLQVSPDGQGLRLVNTVDFEDYLLGISEMPPEWPAAALEAQAVAARTYALWSVLAHRGVGPHDPQICATDDCQVYRGLQREAEAGAVNWSTAVRATSGNVLLYHGLVIEALYGSSDGGRTVSGSVPWLPSVNDPDDQASPLDHWSWSAPLSSLSAALGVPAGWSLAGLVSQGGVIQVTLQAADGSGRTATETLGSSAFVQLLNTRLSPAPAGLPLPLPSWRYQVSTSGNAAVVEGWGFGHGMGMSQYGALGKALRGMNAASILSSYYGPARPVALNGGQEPSTIRVGLADGLPGVTVESTGNFVLVDGSGKAVAVGGAGQWRVEPAGGGVRVVSSAGFQPGATASPAPTPPPTSAAAAGPAPGAVPELAVQRREAVVGLTVPARHRGRGSWPRTAAILLAADVVLLARLGRRGRVWPVAARPLGHGTAAGVGGPRLRSADSTIASARS